MSEDTQGDETPSSFQCSICGEWHDGPPMSYSEKVPHAVAAIPDAELDRRVVFTLDQCVIDQREFYLRGRIPVLVIGRQEPFIWGVWARVAQQDFIRCNERWKVEGRETESSVPSFPTHPLAHVRRYRGHRIDGTDTGGGPKAAF